jgi:tRNA pseudouridine38-40 synthase
MQQPRHYKVVLAYDGTDFAGWQAQATRAGDASDRTVQGVLEAALFRLEGGASAGAERVAVVAASRTDAGVHALGQVVCFRLVRDLAPDALARALNGLLPPDVRVVAAGEAAEDFHARKSAVGKLYRYVLDSGPVQLPTRRRTAGHVPWTLDVDAVRAAAALYMGRHDFASLRSSGSSAKTTVRTITRSAVEIEAATLVYEVEADGFLRKMVRSLVGGLVAAGRGALTVEDLRRALEARDRRAWPAPAPACGLTLLRVYYPGDEAPVLP